MIVGGSGWTATACAALERFAERWQLPVGCAFRFQDVFDNRHPNYAGDVGIGINPKLAARIGDADLVLAIGARLGEMTTGGYELLVPPRPAQRLVHVHAGAEELGRVYAADLLDPCVDGVRRACARGRSQRPQRSAGGRGPMPRTPITKPTGSRHRSRRSTWPRSSQAIDRHVGADTVFTNGAGNFAGWLHRFHRYAGLRHAGRTQLAPTSGAMGYGLPAAVAAALLEPQRTVVNLAGDGDFLMTGAGDGDRDRARRETARLDRRRQRQLRDDPHAPGARVPGARLRLRSRQPRLRRARAGLTAGGPATASTRPSDVRACLRRCARRAAGRR